MERMKDLREERCIGLDLLKVIGIFLVVFSHFNNMDVDIIGRPCVETYVNYFLYAGISGGVPTLFLVNGALMMNRPLDPARLLRRTLRIVILCFFWGAVTLLALMWAKGEPFAPAAFVRDVFYWKEGYLHHLWFLHVLVMIYPLMLVIVPAWQARTKGCRMLIVCTVCLYYGNELLQEIANAVQHLLGRRLIDANFGFLDTFNLFRGRFGCGLALILLGGVLFAERERLRTWKWKLLAAAAVVAGWGGITAFGIFESRMNGVRYAFATTDVLSLYGGLLAVGMFILLQDVKITGFPAKALALVGKNTMSVYLLHWILGTVVLARFPGVLFSNCIAYDYLLTLINVLVCALLGAAARRVPVLREAFHI